MGAPIDPMALLVVVMGMLVAALVGAAALLVLTLLAVVYALSTRAGRVSSAWERFVTARRLTTRKGVWSGLVGSRTVHATQLYSSEEDRGEQTVFEVDLGIRDLAFRVLRDGAWAPGGAQVGDPPFDQAVSLSVNDVGRGWLSDEVRKRILGMRHVGTLVLDRGRLRLVISGWDHDSAKLEAWFDALGELAAAFERAGGDLAARARADAIPGVRRACLADLTKIDPVNGRVTAEHLARTDPDPWVRIDACAWVGEVTPVAMAALDASLPLLLRRHAAGAWARLDGAPAVTGCLRHPELWDAVMKGLDGHWTGDVAAAWLPVVGPLGVGSPDPRVAAWARAQAAQWAKMWEAYPVAGADRALVGLLTTGDAPAVAAAVAALGSVGSVESVPALRALQRTYGVLDLLASQSVDRAVARIQRRASGEVGGLALAELGLDVGELSIVETPPPARPRRRELQG